MNVVATSSTAVQFGKAAVGGATVVTAVEDAVVELVAAGYVADASSEHPVAKSTIAAAAANTGVDLNPTLPPYRTSLPKAP